MLSPQSHALQLAPSTAKFSRWNKDNYYGLGVVVTNGWIVQAPSFGGYAAIMGYLPARKLAIAVTATLGEKASLAGNRAQDIAKQVAQYLAPEAPL